MLSVAAAREIDTLLVTSLGREDKTTVAANLAAALALSGRQVILICADLRWGRTHELFGVSNDVGLTTVLAGDVSLAGALQDTEIRRLQLLPAGPSIPDPAAMLQSPVLLRVLGQLRRRANFLVIDAPPVLASADTEALAELCGMIMLVADARLSRRAQVRAATHRLGRASADRTYCIFDNVGRGRSTPGPLPTMVAAKSQRAGKPNDSDLVNVPSSAPNGHAVLPSELPRPESEPLIVDSLVAGGTDQ